MGKFFTFGQKKDEGASVANPAASIQATSESDIGHPLLAQARENAKAAMDASPRRKGRPPKDTGTMQSDSRALPQAIQDEIQKQLEGALSPKAWSALLALPADTALAISGHEHWKISSDERETLGATGSALARTMMIANPKTLCAIMLASALMSVYLPRSMREIELYQQRKKMRAAKSEEKKP